MTFLVLTRSVLTIYPNNTCQQEIFVIRGPVFNYSVLALFIVWDFFHIPKWQDGDQEDPLGVHEEIQGP